MASMLLYKDIKRLNRDEHQSLRLRSLPSSEFAAATHMVPLAGIEFLHAARHYPIVFVGEERSMPIALLGLEEGHNGFVETDRQWRANTYVPAFVRRYPFVLAQDEPDDFAVCFDAAYSGWSQHEGRRLFGDDGRNSEFLDEMLGFLQQFAVEMARTRVFMTKLDQLDLLMDQALEMSHSGGERFTLSGFRMIDEEKFQRLSDAQVLDLQHSGFLGWIYAHLMSLGNLDRLFEDFLASKARQAIKH